MRGFVLNLNAVRDEDLWVSILSPARVLRLYRFYGARHSVIQVGHKIDFEEEREGRIPRLRHVIHLGFPWERESHKRYWWQQYIQLLYRHLHDVEEIEEFYYLLLERLSLRLEKQEAKRAILEAHTELLKKEGRSDGLVRCFLCEKEIGEHVAFARGFLGAHPECVLNAGFRSIQARRFLSEGDATQMSDEEIEELWKVLLLGI